MALQRPKRGMQFTFGYGSNMCLGRMRCRVPSACPVSVAELAGFEFVFQKRSADKSSKGDARQIGKQADRVLGVVFEVERSQLKLLDEAEGKGSGYRVRWLTVREVGGDRSFRAKTYVAANSHVDPGLKPYNWYKRHVVAGAEFFKLDEIDPQYVARIKAMDSGPDPDAKRERRQLRFPCDKDVDRANWTDLDCAHLPLRPCA